MAIVFTKQKRKQSSLLIILVVLVVVALGAIWFVFFKPTSFSVLPSVSVPPVKNININFEVLEEIKDFQPFTEIRIFEKVGGTEPGGEGAEDIREINAGRENPFLPY